MPRTLRFSSPAAETVRAIDVETFSRASRRTAATRRWTRARRAAGLAAAGGAADLARDGAAGAAQAPEHGVVGPRAGVPGDELAVGGGDDGERLQADVDPGAPVRCRLAPAVPVEVEGNVPSAGVAADADGLDAAAPAEALLEADPADLRQADPAAVEPDVLVGQSERRRAALGAGAARGAGAAASPGLVERPELAAVDPVRGLHHPPEPRRAADPGGEAVEVLAGGLGVEGPLEAGRDPLPAVPAEGVPAVAVAVLAVALPEPSSRRGALPRTSGSACGPGPGSRTGGCGGRSSPWDLGI